MVQKWFDRIKLNGDICLDGIRSLPSVEPERCGYCISRRAIIGKCEDTAKATSESGEINTGFIMALDFIADYAKHMPSVDPEKTHEPCEDVISRREAIKKFTYSYKGERIPDYDCDNFPTQIDIKTVKEILRGLPSIIPADKTESKNNE